MKKRKKVLIVYWKIPYPLYSGGNVRIFNLIKRISRSVDVYIASMSDEKLTGNAEHLRPYCKKLFIVPIVTDRNKLQKMLLFLNPQEWSRIFKRIILMLRGVPYKMLKFYHPAFRDKLREIISSEYFDIIQFEFLYTGQYISELTNISEGTRTVLVEHGITYVQVKRELNLAKCYKKVKFILQYVLNRRYEKKMIARFDHIITVSGFEKEELLKLSGDKKEITVIKNGVDTELFKDTGTPDNGRKIVFLGTLRYKYNSSGLVWFLDRVFPMVKEKVGEVSLQIIGDKDRGIEEKYKNDDVVFLGVVEELRKQMGRGKVFIAPITVGAGTRLKILTAMAFSMPVVTTSAGIEGIEAAEDEGVIVADDEKDFADAVSVLLLDRKRRFVLGDKARKFVARGYSWDMISDQMGSLYGQICYEGD